MLLKSADFVLDLEARKEQNGGKASRGCRLENPSRNFCFGPFELRSRSHELYKHGVKLKLRLRNLFESLDELLSRSGGAGYPGELREKLWSSETFVDFREQSLNTSIKELRA